MHAFRFILVRVGVMASSLRPLFGSALALVALSCGAQGSGSRGMPSASVGVPASVATPFEPPANGYTDMNLYQGDPPNYLATAPPESIDPTIGTIADVSVSTLRRYPVDLTRSSGVAFVVFPGGGYKVLDMERQGTALAARLGPLGFSVFGLKSRVGAGSADARRDALLDARRALRLLRSHATEWHLDPSRIGTVSFSAGSHLALTLVGQLEAEQPMSDDALKEISDRPDFMAVLCPAADGQSMSPFTFTSATPATYLSHAEDDTTSPIALSRAIEQQLQALGTLEHLEVYATGGHFAFNVGDPTATGRDWPDKFLPWLKTNQLIP